MFFLLFDITLIGVTLIFQVALARILIRQAALPFPKLRERLQGIITLPRSYPVDTSRETWEAYIAHESIHTDPKGFPLTSVDKALAYQALKKFEFEGPVPPALWAFIPRSVQDCLAQARAERSMLRVLIGFYVGFFVLCSVFTVKLASGPLVALQVFIALFIILLLGKDRTFPAIKPPSKPALKKHIQHAHRVRLETQEGQITVAAAPSQGGNLTLTQAGTGELEVCT